MTESRLVAVALLVAAMTACGGRITHFQATDSARVFSQGVISDGHEQWRITFSPDGRTAMFAESEGFFPITRKATIHVSIWDGVRWSEPVVAPFSGTHTDMDPAFSPDGRRVYFSSIRPVNGALRGDLDLWYVERLGDRWGSPTRLADGVNTTADELYASVAGDGTLYFASGPIAPAPGAHWDIFVARPGPSGFAGREALPPAINRVPSAGDASVQSAWEFNPEISRDGRTLVFTSLRAGGHGYGDLYVSHLRDGAWTPARNLGPLVNTAADEFHPTLSPDGRALFFVRRIPAKGDFYVVSAAAVPALR